MKVKFLGAMTLIIGFTFAALSIFAANTATDTYSYDFDEDLVLTLDSKQLSYTDLLIDPYDKVDVFISEEKVSPEPFTLLAGSWEEYLPNGTLVEVEIRFKEDGVWTDWLHVDEELESQEDYVSQKYGLASSNSADSFQYKYILYSEGNKTPVVSDISWSLIKTAESTEAVSAPVPMFASSSLSSNITYLALSVHNSDIISRKSWGANENYRYLKYNNPSTGEESSSNDDYEKEDDSKKMPIVKEIRFDENGDEYTWNLQYPEKVEKIIIHHTATTSNLSNPKQAIRDIYYYHAVKKGWGDIGYNYIVDKDGNIYEGRYGGEGVVGGHAYGFNTGSIGIAVLGNYDVDEPSSKVISALTDFIAEKTEIHNIDINGKSRLNGEYLNNILGHRDVGATACPGQNLYEKLPALKNSAENTSKDEKKQKYVKDYDYIDQSKTSFLELDSDETVSVTMKFENIGKETWNSKTFIVVNQNPNFEDVISFPSKDGAVLAKMKESSVRPGKTATFIFKVKPEDIPKLVYMEIAPVINGTKKIDDYTILPVNVHASYYDFEIKNKKTPDTAMEAGEREKVYVNIKNTGTKTWSKNSKLIGSLGTELTLKSSVSPGKTAKFEGYFKAPTSKGAIRESFSLKLENDIYIENIGLYFETTVLGDGSIAGEIVSKTTRSYVEKGRTYVYYAQIRNLSTNTWYKRSFDLDINKSSSVFVNDVDLRQTSIKPGEIAHITFKVSFSSSVGDLENLEIMPTFAGKAVLENAVSFPLAFTEKGTSMINLNSTQTKTTNSLKFDDPVVETSGVIGTDNMIRVKLSFEGNPKITSSNGMTVYSGSEKLFTLEKGESVSVEKASSKYLLKRNDGKLTYRKDEIRFIPNENSILEIENFENRPAWNNSLNDNQYRGILEVNRDGDDLLVINELDIEYYLKGLGEVGNSDPTEKIKTIIVAARTYAKYYTTLGIKFPGQPYDLDDDPDVSQKYLGYGFEKRAGAISKAVDDTRGMVVTYNGTLIKTPYFSRSDGVMTKSSQEVWGYSMPYLVPVSDAYCSGSESFAGHGVGLSGCGATGMAEQGYSFDEILEYYYTGTKVSKVY